MQPWVPKDGHGEAAAESVETSEGWCSRWSLFLTSLAVWKIIHVILSLIRIATERCVVSGQPSAYIWLVQARMVTSISLNAHVSFLNNFKAGSVYSASRRTHDHWQDQRLL